MSPSISVIKRSLFKKISKKIHNSTLVFELEFPIVHTKGKPTDIEVSKDLLRFLVDALGLEVEKEDRRAIRFNL